MIVMNNVWNYQLTKTSGATGPLVLAPAEGVGALWAPCLCFLLLFLYFLSFCLFVFFVFFFVVVFFCLFLYFCLSFVVLFFVVFVVFLSFCLLLSVFCCCCIFFVFYCLFFVFFVFLSFVFLSFCPFVFLSCFPFCLFAFMFFLSFCHHYHNHGVNIYYHTNFCSNPKNNFSILPHISPQTTATIATPPQCFLYLRETQANVLRGLQRF